jgi:WD40 repeat protein
MAILSNKLMYPILAFFLGVILFCSCKQTNSPEPSQSTMTPSANAPTLTVQPSTIIPTATPTWVSPIVTPTATSPTTTPTPNIESIKKIDLFTKLKPGDYLLYIRKNYLGVLSADGSENYEQELPLGWNIPRLSLSPDRKYLLFTISTFSSFPNISPGAVMILNLEKSEIQILVRTDPCYNYTGGAWSPDGKQFAVGCRHNINIFSIETGTIKELPMECISMCSHLQWSPDGKWLSFQMGDDVVQDRNGIYVLSTNCLDAPKTCIETRRGPLSDAYGPGFGPAVWSPDGKYLAVPGAVTGEGLRIDLINIQTGIVERQLPISEMKLHFNDALAWSPDGKWIAFNQQLDGVYLTPSTGGIPRRIALFPDDGIQILHWISIPPS